MAKKVYAVKKGKKTGIFATWAECKANVDGYSGAQFKSFATKAEAEAYLGNISKEDNPSQMPVLLMWTEALMQHKRHIPMAASFFIRNREQSLVKLFTIQKM